VPILKVSRPLRRVPGGTSGAPGWRRRRSSRCARATCPQTPARIGVNATARSARTRAKQAPRPRTVLPRPGPEHTRLRRLVIRAFTARLRTSRRWATARHVSSAERFRAGIPERALGEYDWTPSTIRVSRETTRAATHEPMQLNRTGVTASSRPGPRLACMPRRRGGRLCLVGTRYGTA
jgi:hypothetical protein